MPKVGDKEFPYTPKGIQKAAKESSKSGIPVQDAGNRAKSYHLGGKIPGEQGFGQKPLQNPGVMPKLGENNQLGGMFRHDPQWDQAWHDAPQGSKADVIAHGELVDKQDTMKKGGKVESHWASGNIASKESLYERNLAKRKASKKRADANKEKQSAKARRKASRKASRKGQERRNIRKIAKLEKKGAVTTTATKSPGGAIAAKKELKPTGRIRAGAKAVKVTKGGAYASYGKKSAAAKSFRKAYAGAKKGSTFTWDGRKYKKD